MNTINKLFKISLIGLLFLGILNIVIQLFTYFDKSGNSFILIFLTIILRTPTIVIYSIFILIVIIGVIMNFKKATWTKSIMILLIFLFGSSIFARIDPLIDLTPVRRTLLPKRFTEIQLQKTGYFSDKKTQTFLSPSSKYKLVKYFVDPTMAFGSGTTSFGIYNQENNRIGELWFPESFFDSEVEWKTDSTIVLNHFIWDSMEPVQIDKFSEVLIFKGTNKFRLIKNQNSLRYWLSKSISQKLNVANISISDFHLNYCSSDSSGSETGFDILIKDQKHIVTVRVKDDYKKLFLDGSEVIEN